MTLLLVGVAKVGACKVGGEHLGTRVGAKLRAAGVRGDHLNRGGLQRGHVRGLECRVEQNLRGKIIILLFCEVYAFYIRLDSGTIKTRVTTTPKKDKLTSSSSSMIGGGAVATIEPGGLHFGLPVRRVC